LEETKTDESKPNNNKHKELSLIVLGIVILMGLLTLFFYLRYKATHITTDDAFVDGHIHTIASKVKGTVKNIYVKDSPLKKETCFWKSILLIME
jgi:membrane fusion protein (multidrug efflux system)